MTTENPLVSIIIPCYNLSGYLEACLSSCMLQSYKNIEIIIINDGSIDNTKEIIDFHKQIDNRIISINKNNEGVVNARKTGINNSKGEYITFLDGDDYLPLDAIEILVTEMISSNADLVIGQMLEEFDTGFQKVQIINNDCLNGNELIKKILKDKFFGLCATLYKRNLFNETLNFHSELKNGEDVVLLIQLANNSKKIKRIDKTVYFYRNRSSSITKEPLDQNFQDSFKSRFLVEKYALESGFEKEKDFELCKFMGDSLTFMLLKKFFNSIDEKFKDLVRKKIKEYMIDNKQSASFYRNISKKNFKRLIYYYRFPYLYKESLFQIYYKIFKKVL